MKKIFVAMLLLGVLCASLKAADGFGWGVWYDVPDYVSSQKVEGITLGVPVMANDYTHGVALALCGNNTQRMDGFQGALFGFNFARSLEGVQLGFANIHHGQHGEFAVQVGGFNLSSENGVQVGFFNQSKNNATFQLGLININKNGWLPIMIFVNFSRELFD